MNSDRILKYTDCYKCINFEGDFRSDISQNSQDDDKPPDCSKKDTFFPIEIRKGKKSDIYQLVVIEKQSFESTDYPIDSKLFKILLANRHISIFTAVHDNLVVGYVCLILGNRIGSIYSIAVLKEYRGKGIGTALLEEAEHHALALGADIIQLDVRCNSRAVALYQRNGYSVKHIRNNYYGNCKHAYRMIKDLQCGGCNIEKFDAARKRDRPADAAVAT